MIQTLVIYNLLITFLTILFLRVIQQTIPDKRIVRSVFFVIAHFCITFLAGVLYPDIDGFSRVRLLAWGVFLHLPFFLVVMGFFFWKDSRKFGLVLFGIAVLIGIIAVDAFLIEPQWLEISRHTLQTPKLDQSVSVAVLADIQTDQVGPYEEEVLALVQKENPDLILLAGDYLQIYEVEDYLEELARFQQIFLRAGFDPPLGIYAVRGNVDWENW